MRRWLRYAWAAPNSLAGLVLAATAGLDGEITVVEGVVEAHGRALRWLLSRLVPLPGGAAALTLGHVVIGVCAEALDRTRSHERAHVRQYERWGPLFLFAYAAASALAVARGGHVYLDNHFERDACRQAGEGERASRARGRQGPPWISSRRRSRKPSPS